MPDIKIHGNRPTCSREEEIEGLNRIVIMGVVDILIN